MSMNTTMIFRIQMDKKTVTFGDVVSSVNAAGGDIVAVDMIRAGKESTVRDITVQINVDAHERLEDCIRLLSGVQVVHVSDSTFLAHLGGKIQVVPKTPIKNREDL